MSTCTSNTLDLALIAFAALMGVLNLTMSYFRHKHIMSDNRRLLHVIENKTAHADDVT